LHSLGRSGISGLVERCCAHARHLAAGLQEIGFEVLNEVVLNQVVATLPGREALMPEIARQVQASGEAWFGPTTWRGRQAIRLSVSSWVTSETDVHRTLDAISRATRTASENLQQS
jgi:glutamate/tyrosine decarboxylase-like PLP-dependent enzyme